METAKNTETPNEDQVKNPTQQGDTAEQVQTKPKKPASGKGKSATKPTATAAKKKAEETPAKGKTELKEEAHAKRCREIAMEYKKLYPSIKEFHITPDYQVFLGENKSAAESHASKRGGAVQTIKFD